MTAHLKALSLSTGFVLLALAGNQALAQTAPTTTEPADHAAFSSHGISAVIAGVTATVERQADIKIQLLLKNETPKNVAIAAISGAMSSASSNNGVQLTMQDVSGMPHCAAAAPEHIENCLKTFPQASYLEVDAGQSAGVLLHFIASTPRTAATGSLSFSLRLMEKELGDSEDSLSSQASGTKPGSQPHIITINFPLVPLGPAS
jgi:hypothetical protein